MAKSWLYLIAAATLGLLETPASAAWGDNAPPVPANWCTAHPCLPHPTDAQYTALWNAGGAGVLPTRYSTAVTTINSSCATTPACSVQTIRYALLGYLAAKKNGGNVSSGIYKQAHDNLLAIAKRGTLGTAFFVDSNFTESTGCTTSCVLTNSVIDFSTACGGGSCADVYVTYQGLRFVTNTSLTDNHTVTLFPLSSYSPLPFPSGSGLTFEFESVQYGMNPWFALEDMLYDYLYADLVADGSATLVANIIANLATCVEHDWNQGNYSPYNDVTYIEWGAVGELWAGVIYPDLGPTGLAHWRFGNDLLWNAFDPVFKYFDGAWPEAWGEYIDQGAPSLSNFMVSGYMLWAQQTGSVATFFAAHPYLGKYPYFFMYSLRPDGMMEKYGDTNGFPQLEGTGGCGAGSPFGNLFTAVAEIYNDQHVRWIARPMANECLDGFEPAAWPYYTPDASDVSHPTHDWSDLPLCRAFPAVGLTACRTGWTEDDTYFTFTYQNDFWSKPHFNAGAWAVFTRGSNAIHSGTYSVGYQAPAREFYSQTTIADNTLTLTDPAETISNQYFLSYAYGDAGTCGNGDVGRLLPLNGGQRVTGSQYQTYYSNSACTTGLAHTAALDAPLDISQWYRDYDWVHKATPLANQFNGTWNYVAADITAAYNRTGGARDLPWSDGTATHTVAIPNANDRTQRTPKVVRQMVMINHGHSAYIIDYVQATTVNANIVKALHLHTIHQPSVTSNCFTVTRTDNATVQPANAASNWPNGTTGFLLSYKNQVSTAWHYQYNGKLKGCAVGPGSPVLNLIGGTGSEFDDGSGLRTSPTTLGVNQNACMNAPDPIATGSGPACDGLGHSGLGNVAGFANPDETAAPLEPGSWRIQETLPTAATQDWFINVYYSSANSDTNTFTTPVLTQNATTFTETWTDNGGTCTYVVTFSKVGFATPVLSVTGAGCVATI